MKTFLFIAVRVIGSLFIGALLGYLFGVIWGLVMTWQNNSNPQNPSGSYLWWANFMGLLIMTFTWLPGAIIGLFWGVAAHLSKRAKT